MYSEPHSFCLASNIRVQMSVMSVMATTHMFFMMGKVFSFCPYCITIRNRIILAQLKQHLGKIKEIKFQPGQ